MVIGKLKSLVKRLKVGSRPRLPEQMRVYAIGDIHGCHKLLMTLQRKIEDDLAANPVKHPVHIFLGDYVDRGPDSAKVIDALIDIRNTVPKSHFLMGNHEHTLLSFLSDAAVLDEWYQYGGLETIRSYGLDVARSPGPDDKERIFRSFRASLPDKHLQFLRKLESHIELEGYLFVHAGVRPGTPIANQSLEDLLWIRREFLDYPGDYGAYVVHGHTPSTNVEIKPNRLNADTGAYITGRLSCAVLENDSVRILNTLPEDR